MLYTVDVFQIHVHTFPLFWNSDPTAAIPAKLGMLWAGTRPQAPVPKDASHHCTLASLLTLAASATSLDLAPTMGTATTCNGPFASTNADMWRFWRFPLW